MQAMPRGEISSRNSNRSPRCGHEYAGATLFIRAVVALALLPTSAGAQPGHCDPQLAPPAGNPYGYRLRGERCEGVYVRQLSNSALVLASFTLLFEDFDAAHSEDLLVQWKAPSSAEVRVRARTLDRRLHYRMDAIRQKGTASFRWPAGLLYALQIQQGNLGVLVWVPSDASPIRRELYLPVRVFQKQGQLPRGSLQLVLLPSLELSEVYVSLASVNNDGGASRMIRDGEALRYGYYPADRSIVFSVPAPPSAGIFYLEIAASLKSGGSVTLPVWFYHSQTEEAVQRPSGGH